jgi:hypothetical protein
MPGAVDQDFERHRLGEVKTAFDVHGLNPIILPGWPPAAR